MTKKFIREGGLGQQSLILKSVLSVVVYCPDRITVLHKTGTLDPSGCPGSTPGLGVYF